MAALQRGDEPRPGVRRRNHASAYSVVNRDMRDMRWCSARAAVVRPSIHSWTVCESAYAMTVGSSARQSRIRQASSLVYHVVTARQCHAAVPARPCRLRPAGWPRAPPCHAANAPSALAGPVCGGCRLPPAPEAVAAVASAPASSGPWPARCVRQQLQRDERVGDTRPRCRANVAVHGMWYVSAYV